MEGFSESEDQLQSTLLQERSLATNAAMCVVAMAVEEEPEWVPDLMKVLLQMAEQNTRTSEAFTQLLEAMHNRSDKAKVPEAAVYTSKSLHEYKVWVRDLDEYLDSKRSIYTTEHTKINYARGHVKESVKGNWDARYAADQIDWETTTLDNFKNELRAALGNEDRQIATI